MTRFQIAEKLDGMLNDIRYGEPSELEAVASFLEQAAQEIDRIAVDDRAEHEGRTP